MQPETRREVWNAIQAFCAVYCSFIGTWALVRPPQATVAATTNAGSGTPHLVWWFWILIGGFILCAVVLAVGTVVNLVRKVKAVENKIPDIMVNDVPVAGPLAVESQSKKGKAAWQKLEWCNAERERLGRELKECQKGFAETSVQRDHFQQQYATSASRATQLEKELSTKPEIHFSALQIEIFQLAEKLKKFMVEVGDKPKFDKQDFPNTSEGIEQYLRAQFVLERPWVQRVQSMYQSDFAKPVEIAIHHLGIKNVHRHHLNGCAGGGIRSQEDLQRLIDFLTCAALELDGVYLFPRNTYSAEFFETLSENERNRRIREEPGFEESWDQYQRDKVLKGKTKT